MNATTVDFAADWTTAKRFVPALLLKRGSLLARCVQQGLDDASYCQSRGVKRLQYADAREQRAYELCQLAVQFYEALKRVTALATSLTLAIDEWEHCAPEEQNQ